MEGSRNHNRDRAIAYGSPTDALPQEPAPFNDVASVLDSNPEPTAIPPDVDPEKIIEQTCEEIKHWEDCVARHLDDFNLYANTWRLDIPNRGKDLANFSNTRTSETTRAVETLSTMIFRMMTSNDPNFALYPLRDDVTEDHLFKNEAVLRMQQRRLFYRRKLLKACRGLTLFGTQIVETPWFQDIGNGQVYFEGTDFVPRSLLQFAFDPAVPDIKLSDYHTPMDFISANRLRMMAKQAPHIWDAQAIEDAITGCKNTDLSSTRVRDRLQRAGYQMRDAKVILLTTRWGVDENGNEVVWSILNDKHLARYHPLPFASGKRPFLISSMIDFELEPYGYGVGNLGKRTQAELDANQNRNNDLMTFSQFHMWKLARSSGLRLKDLRIKPFKVIELDKTDSLEALRPDLGGLSAGLEHQDRLREDFRAVSGATNNLQAVDSGATATESSLNQNEAVRRVSVISEVVAEEYVREYINACLRNNAQLLDQPLWVSITGEAMPALVPPAALRKEIGVEAKITTDKDFRPERTRRMIEFLSTLTSIRQQIPGDVDVTPIIQELSRSFGVDPKKVIHPKTAMDKMMEAIKVSQSMAGHMNPTDPRAMAAATMRGNAQGAQEDLGSQDVVGPDMGNAATVSTPLGDVAGSPGMNG